MQIGVSVSIPASLSVRTTSSAASVPSTPSIFAAGRLGIEMGAEADRRLRHVAALAQAEHRAERIDMHLEAGGLAGVAEPVAHLLVLGPSVSRRTPPFGVAPNFAVS